MPPKRAREERQSRRLAISRNNISEGDLEQILQRSVCHRVGNKLEKSATL